MRMKSACKLSPRGFDSIKLHSFGLVGMLPLIKLGYLFIRTIAKPFSSGIKRYAKNHQSLNHFFISVAQAYHRSEVKMRRRLNIKATNLTHLSTIKPLDRERAIELGASFVAESIVFILAGSVLLIDQIQSRTKESERRLSVDEKINSLISSIKGIESKLEDFEKQHEKFKVFFLKCLKN